MTSTMQWIDVGSLAHDDAKMLTAVMELIDAPHDSNNDSHSGASSEESGPPPSAADTAPKPVTEAPVPRKLVVADTKPMVTVHRHSHAKAEPREPRKRSKVPTRQRRQLEATQLREMVAQLESELAALRQTRGRQRCLNVHDHMALVWQELAQRQKYQRERAQAENERLRDSLRARVKVGQRLMRLFRRAMEQQRDTLPARAPGRTAPSLPLSYHPMEFAQLDALYHQRAHAFTADCFHGATTDFNEFTPPAATGIGTAGFGVRTGWAIPMPVVRVLEATWKESLDHAHAKENQVVEFKSVDIPGDIAVVIFRGYLPPLTSDASDVMSVNGKIMLKKYFEPSTNEGVIVATWSGSIVRGKVSIGYSEENLIRIQKAEVPTAGVDRRPADWVTTIHTSLRIRRTTTTRFGKYLSKLEAMMLSSLENEIGSRRQATENRLLRPRSDPA